jgi:hypothetical protein
MSAVRPGLQIPLRINLPLIIDSKLTVQLQCHKLAVLYLDKIRLLIVREKGRVI